MEIQAELPRGGGRQSVSRWPEVLELVRENAPNWCRVGEYNPSVVTRIRKGAYKSIDPTKYEVVSRNIRYDENKRQRSDIWMRWIG